MEKAIQFFVVKFLDHPVRFNRLTCPPLYELVAEADATRFDSQMAAAYEAGRFNLRHWRVMETAPNSDISRPTTQT